MREKTVSILDRLFWTVQPPKGLIHGNYYHEEMRFAPSYEGAAGHLGAIDVVTDQGKLVMVEFHETCSPTYYTRMYQNADKRLSSYGFFQASKERTAKTGVVLANGFTSLEQQMLKENRLTGSFQLVAGASNSLNRCMLPLAEKVAARMDQPSNQKYYGLSKELEPGVTGRLQLVLQNGHIIKAFYDEIFADTPEEIVDPELKPYSRQSKYFSLEYCTPSGPGFNALVDLLTAHIINTGQLLNLNGLPYTDPEHFSPIWKSYLLLAEELDRVLGEDLALEKHETNSH